MDFAWNLHLLGPQERPGCSPVRASEPEPCSLLWAEIAAHSVEEQEPL